MTTADTIRTKLATWSERLVALHLEGVSIDFSESKGPDGMLFLVVRTFKAEPETEEEPTSERTQQAG